MFSLAPGLHACIVGETPVLLSEVSGRYTLLRGETARHLCAFLRDQSDHEAQAALIARGLIERSVPPSFRHPGTPRPVSSYFDVPTIPFSAKLLIRGTLALRRSCQLVRRHSLTDILAHLRTFTDEGGRATTAKTAEEGAIAATFRRIQRILPSTTQCLPRSIAIAAMLRDHGCNPTVIIGVQLPISAHCWVQCEDRVIGDTLDRVAAFQPIWAS